MYNLAGQSARQRGETLGISIFNGGGSVSDEEIALGTPDAHEARNLEYHVSRCSMRYRMFTKRQAKQGQNLNQIKLLILGVGGYLIIVSDPARNALGFVLKIFGG